MSTTLLVVTIDAAFGELLCKNLEESGPYRVLIADTEDKVLSLAKSEKPALALLDTTSGVDEALEVGRLLHEMVPCMIISDSGWHSVLEELSPQGYIPKSYDLPDLLELLARFFKPQPASGAAQSKLLNQLSKHVTNSNDPRWLEDINRAAQHLTRLTLESSAQAALITRDDVLWAYAGQLPQDAARELVAALLRYWDRQGGSDLLRFVRLNTTAAEHMLYATRLAKGMVLALVFDAETPFTTIRSQANSLVKSLSVLPATEEKQPEADMEGEEEEEDEVNPDVASLADILGSVPAPDPQQDTQVSPARYSVEPASDQLATVSFTESLSQEVSPTVILDSALPADEVEEETEQQVEIELQSDTLESITEDATIDNLAETRPRPVSDTARRIVLEPVSSSFYNLTYACLLIPRFNHHYLSGDLRTKLSEWVLQISVAYGWRLEHISIRPDHLQWIINVPPAAAPGYVMRIYRQQLSEKIFADFPRLKQENPSGDFWAPGYLIVGGTQPLPERLIREFIEQARHRQGLSRPPHII